MLYTVGHPDRARRSQTLYTVGVYGFLLSVNMLCTALHFSHIFRAVDIFVKFM